MESGTRLSLRLIAACLGMILAGCGAIELRHSSTPIEVIDNNFMESTDTEVSVMQPVPARGDLPAA